ncbi:uncharacterized protein TRIADDRAFT_61844 [Trichoplax adhaerens]|uniref:Heat shock 70 kDa protein 14 n=1 Tax=Trichoplax adhaerens TaxID=10228 RepID=B3SC45_TRIAD|nr:hypothetical protein TRIADDRAFT_61844 [Trichoplax adhaerens]EDV19738.1 hypothetical protein TRIADDRAFT_61844 [Trichoplax adhaerens]|eukprot:XP_002117762.1 hypothetical protein TRIADDRAFT_61844 [Trichoplax adhaerens]
MTAFGLHFGGTNLTLAVCKDGQTEILANNDGHRSTPAVIACKGAHYAVGINSALNYRPGEDIIVENIRSIIGLKSEDFKVQEFVRKSKCKIESDEEDIIFKFKENLKDTFTLSRLVVLLLQKMKEITQTYTQEEPIRVVLAVPVYYKDVQILALKAAAEEVGFNVLRFVKEPCAAALAYQIGQNDIYENGYYLIFRLGGKSTDVTILRVDGGLYEILAYKNEQNFGGEDFSCTISECLIKEFEKKWNVQIPRDSQRALNKFLKAAEQCKQILSLSPTATHFIESAYDGIDYQCSISRTKFEMLCSKLLEKCLNLIDNTLNDTSLTKTDIAKIILSGGSSRILKLQEIIKARFDIPVCVGINPGEVIAIGAAAQGGLISKESSDCSEKTLSVLCSPCGICVSDRESDLIVDDVQVIVPNLCPLPFRKRIPLREVCVENPLVCIYVHQLLRSDKEYEIRPIAKLVLTDLSKDDDNRFIIDVEYKRDGEIKIELIETISKQATSLTIGTEKIE